MHTVAFVQKVRQHILRWLNITCTYIHFVWIHFLLLCKKEEKDHWQHPVSFYSFPTRSCMPLAYVRNYFEYYYLACCVAYLVVAVAYALFLLKVFWSFYQFQIQRKWSIKNTNSKKLYYSSFKGCYYTAFVFLHWIYGMEKKLI